MAATLADLAQQFGGRLRGAGETQIEGVASLDAAGPRHISYVNDRKHKRLLSTTRAGAVLLTEADLPDFSGNALVVENPHLWFARIAAFLHPTLKARNGIHPSASVDAQARIAATVAIGPHVVIEAGAVVEEAVEIGPGCYIGRDAVIRSGSRLVGHVWIGPQCVIGQRCLVHPGAVIGGDGFGYARDGDRWVKVPQLGRVVLGDDVEIGSNTTVDRGALHDTVIANGVKIDNLVQIAHNVHVGENTIMAACVGVSGSVTIGKRCAFGGQVGVAGHLTVADDVQVLGQSLVASSIDEPGTYSSAIKAERAEHWRRQVVRLQQLDDLARQVKQLEKLIQKTKKEE